MEEKVVVPFEECVRRIGDGKKIHTFVNPGTNLLIGADWDRKKILEAFRKYEVEESGPAAMATGHGLVFHDGTKYIFVETKTNNLTKGETK